MKCTESFLLRCKRYCRKYIFLVVQLFRSSFCYWRSQPMLNPFFSWNKREKKLKMLISLFQGIIYSMNSWTKWPLFTLQRLKLCAIYMSKSPKKTHTHEQCLLKEKSEAMEIWRLFFFHQANEFHSKCGSVAVGIFRLCFSGIILFW